MKTLELLENNQKSTKVIKQWFLSRMLDSLADNNVPDDFKEFVKSQDLENDKIAAMIDASPRILFDIFDEHKVYIQINVNPSNFSYSINQGEVISGPWETRIEAEKSAIEQSFTILESKL